MRILCVSDLHFGKSSWGDFGYKVLHKAREIAEAGEVDVLYFGGDMAEPCTENTVLGHLFTALDLHGVRRRECPGRAPTFPSPQGSPGAVWAHASSQDVRSRWCQGGQRERRPGRPGVHHRGLMPR